MAVAEKFTNMTNIFEAVAHLQLNLAEVVSIYLNIPQTQVINIHLYNQKNPFQHEACHCHINTKILPKHQICCRNNVSPLLQMHVQ